MIVRVRERERERGWERVGEGGRGRGWARVGEGGRGWARVRVRERNVFIGNFTSWITNIQGAKYKIQVNSNRQLSYVQIPQASTVPPQHAVHMK